MALGEEESEQRRRLEESLRHADVSLEELWLRYFALGGQAGQFEVEAYIHGAMALPALQRDLLAHALNERLDEVYSQEPRAPYSQVLPGQPGQPGGPDQSGPQPADGSSGSQVHEDGVHEDGVREDGGGDAGEAEKNIGEDRPDPDGSSPDS